jgi:hypothetical protein
MLRRYVPAPFAATMLLFLLAAPSAAFAQSSLTLVEQLRAVDAIATAMAPTTSQAPQGPITASDYQVIVAFARDPWNNQAPTAAQIQSTLKAMTIQLGSAQSALSGSAFSESSLIGGLADFVVNRAKDEATVSFLLDLRDRIKGDALLQVLFKQTLVVLNNLETDAANQSLNSLRSAFTADLRALPQVVLSSDDAANALKALLDKELTGDAKKTADDAIAAFEQNRQLFAVTTSAVRDLINDKPVLASLAGYADLKPPTLATQPQVRYALITAGVVAREYRWAPNDTRGQLSDPLKRSRFLALLKRDLLAGQAAEAAAVATWATKVQETEVSLNEFLTAFDEANSALDSVKHAGTAEVKSEAMAGVAKAVLDVLNAARPFAGTMTNEWDALAKNIADLNQLQVAIVGRDYVAAVTDLGNLLSNDKVPFPTGLLKTLTFAATLATAQSSDDVTNAIEAAALPVLSYQAKRTVTPGKPSTWIGVNAYFGGAVGAERTTGAGASGTNATFGGLTVPIGLEIGKPLSKVGSFSIFVPLIDVGTVASFRFNQSDTEQAPAFKLSQVVAPGLFAVLGITQRYPFSIGFGAQFVPSLRFGTNGAGPFDVIRLAAFAAIDVPLFRF